MTLSTAYANQLLDHILKDVAETILSGITTLYVSLHTASPGAGGTQATNEATYTGYARVAVSRSGSGWTAGTGGAADNAATITFPLCTGGSNTITHVAVGVAASGATNYIAFGALSSSLAVSNNITPKINTGALDWTAT